MTSQTDRTVRSLPDSHPNRPTRPDPSRPITTNRRSIHDLRLLGRPSDKRMGGYAAKIRGVR